jgi:hypothetical protein
MTRTLSLPKGLWWSVDIASFACWLAVVARSFGPAYGLPGAPFTMATHGPFGSAYLLPSVASLVIFTLTLAPPYLALANTNGARPPAKIAAFTALFRIVKLEAMLMLAFSVDPATYTYQFGAIPAVFLVLILATVGAGLLYSTRNT